MYTATQNAGAERTLAVRQGKVGGARRAHGTEGEAHHVLLFTCGIYGQNEDPMVQPSQYNSPTINYHHLPPTPLCTQRTQSWGKVPQPVPVWVRERLLASSCEHSVNDMCQLLVFCTRPPLLATLLRRQPQLQIQRPNNHEKTLQTRCGCSRSSRGTSCTRRAGWCAQKKNQCWRITQEKLQIMIDTSGLPSRRPLLPTT